MSARAARALTRALWLVTLLFALPSHGVGAAELADIGLAGSGTRIDSLVVESRRPAPTVVIIGGLSGDDASSAAVRAAVARLERARAGFRLLAVPVANPDRAALQFPPTGAAYRENAESHVLWRWLGAQAPDLVLVAGNDAGTAGRAGRRRCGTDGRHPGRAPGPAVSRICPTQETPRGLARAAGTAASPVAQSAATGLAAGAALRPAASISRRYIEAVALRARIRLGELADVQRLAAPWVDGTKDPLARPNALIMAGHILFTELYRQTRDPKYLAAVRRVADLGFDADGHMLEAMPLHGEYSDSVFMGTTILAQAGASDRRAALCRYGRSPPAIHGAARSAGGWASIDTRRPPMRPGAAAMPSPHWASR